jgi:hypothetical protein
VILGSYLGRVIDSTNIISWLSSFSPTNAGKYIFSFNICMVHIADTEFWWRDLREGDHFEDPGVDGRIILKWIFKKWDGRSWTGLIWLRIGTGGGLL